MKRFSQLPRRCNKRFKQSPFGSCIVKPWNSNAGSGNYQVAEAKVLEVPSTCTVTSNTLVGVKGTVTDNTLIL